MKLENVLQMNEISRAAISVIHLAAAEYAAAGLQAIQLQTCQFGGELAYNSVYSYEHKMFVVSFSSHKLLTRQAPLRTNRKQS